VDLGVPTVMWQGQVLFSGSSEQLGQQLCNVVHHWLQLRMFPQPPESAISVHRVVPLAAQVAGLSQGSSWDWVDEDIKFKWDTLQRDFQCCGALNFKTGYTDWDRYTKDVMLPGQYQSTRGVPDTCCLEESEGCGVKDTDIFRDIRAHEKIFTHGCLAIMKERLYRDIAPLLLTYIGCCVVLPLLCIVSLVLASAYVASINRKKNYEKDNLGMYSVPMGQQPVG